MRLLIILLGAFSICSSFLVWNRLLLKRFDFRNTLGFLRSNITTMISLIGTSQLVAGMVCPPCKLTNDLLTVFLFQIMPGNLKANGPKYQVSLYVKWPDTTGSVPQDWFWTNILPYGLSHSDLKSYLQQWQLYWLQRGIQPLTTMDVVLWGT